MIHELRILDLPDDMEPTRIRRADKVSQSRGLIMLGPGFGEHLEATEQWTEHWVASVSQRAEQAKALADGVAAITAESSGADGAVRVKVAGSGMLVDIRLDERVLQWTPQEISDEILIVMRRAQGLLTAQVGQMADKTVGADTATGRAVVDGFARRFPVQQADDGGPLTRRDSAAGGRV
ncbi:YbaB/EbfC family nucleoid-associated protein [Micromonospora sp. NPDC003197]